jgi:hypothetical protein
MKEFQRGSEATGHIAIKFFGREEQRIRDRGFFSRELGIFVLFNRGCTDEEIN